MTAHGAPAGRAAGSASTRAEVAGLRAQSSGVAAAIPLENVPSRASTGTGTFRHMRAGSLRADEAGDPVNEGCLGLAVDLLGEGVSRRRLYPSIDAHVPARICLDIEDARYVTGAKK